MADESFDDLPVDPDAAPPASRRTWDVALVVAAGGAIGGTMRHAVSVLVPGQVDGFPWATFVENVTGALLLAVLVVMVVEVWPPNRYVRPFLATGVLGGFTTFSTVMNETRDLLLGGDALVALVYVGATLVCGAAATLGGLRLGRRVARAGA